MKERENSHISLYTHGLIFAVLSMIINLNAYAKNLIVIHKNSTVQVTKNIKSNIIITAGNVKIVDGFSIYYNNPKISPPTTKESPEIVISTP